MKEILVEYRYKTLNEIYGDLVCEVTELMDKYLLYKPKSGFNKTYLYNDLEIFSDSCTYRLAFRVPRSHKRLYRIREVITK